MVLISRDLEVLMLVRQMPSSSVRALARRSGLAVSTVHGALRRLLEAGYVERGVYGDPGPCEHLYDVSQLGAGVMEQLQKKLR